MPFSHAVRTGVPLSVVLAKYCARNLPTSQPPAGTTMNVSGLDAWPSGLRTVTVAELAAMSEAGMLAVSRVPLTNVVTRGDSFQRSVAPDTKLAPSTVSVKAGPPAVAELGLSDVSDGPGGGALPVQLTWMTASPPRS